RLRLYTARAYMYPLSLHVALPISTGPTAASMGEALPRLAALAVKLGRHAEIGPAHEEGYFSSGVRRNTRLDRPAAERALDMLLRSEEHTSELQSRVDLVCRLLL